jgi:TonB family protein
MPAQEAAAEPLPEPTDAPANPDGGADLGAVAGGTGPAMASGNGQGVGAAPVAAAPRVAEKAAEAPPPRRARKGPVRLEDAGTPPKAVRQDPRLGYPREFREKAIAGLVVVQCIITESGKVRACRSRSGPDELATYAISVIRNWEYEPARDHAGKPVAVAFTWRFPFRLS